MIERDGLTPGGTGADGSDVATAPVRQRGTAVPAPPPPGASPSRVETALADYKPWLEDEIDECDQRADRAEARAVAAEARADQLQRERDEQKARADDLEVRMDAEIVAHGETEERAERAETALRQIARLPEESEHWHENDVAVRIARDALADSGVSA